MRVSRDQLSRRPPCLRAPVPIPGQVLPHARIPARDWVFLKLAPSAARSREVMSCVASLPAAMLQRTYCSLCFLLVYVPVLLYSYGAPRVHSRLHMMSRRHPARCLARLSADKYSELYSCRRALAGKAALGVLLWCSRSQLLWPRPQCMQRFHLAQRPMAGSTLPCTGPRLSM